VCNGARESQRPGSAIKPARQRRTADRRRPLHHDEPSTTLEVLNEALGDDLRHELVGVVDALAALEAEREGKPAARSDGSAASGQRLLD
jgi:hypothetical protein